MGTAKALQVTILLDVTAELEAGTIVPSPESSARTHKGCFLVLVSTVFVRIKYSSTVGETIQFL
jgi:hypothetical protein